MRILVAVIIVTDILPALISCLSEENFSPLLLLKKRRENHPSGSNRKTLNFAALEENLRLERARTILFLLVFIIIR